ncbi:HNH endonuclease [Rhodococcoides trifolii]|uniref:HNH endonuclease n=1 Tax=Rhodococcoides trifolii TaxID=908250 RepID=A0A917FUA7_9NOCA|nr:HNH endonuclease [Rhodococcus trifolii]
MKNKSHRHRQLGPADDRSSGASALHAVPDRPDVSIGRVSDAQVAEADAIVADVVAGGAPPISDTPPAGDSVPAWAKRRVLLLNATYEPLTALPMRRAVVLLVCEKAVVVHDDEEGPFIRSAGLSVQVPSVIRLRTFVRVPYRARVPMTRAALMHRDRFRCAYCGSKAETIDHVVPRSRGGEHSWENCVACCASCNHRKADKLLSEIGWTLRAALVPPKGPHWRLIASTKELDPTWLRYLGEGAA